MVAQCAVAQSCDSSVCYPAGILSYFKLSIDAGWAQGLYQGPREVTAVQAHVRRVLLVHKERVHRTNTISSSVYKAKTSSFPLLIWCKVARNISLTACMYKAIFICHHPFLPRLTYFQNFPNYFVGLPPPPFLVLFQERSRRDSFLSH